MNNNDKEQQALEPNLSIEKKDPISLEEARTILQAVVATNEKLITPDTKLDQVAGYSSEQVGEAALVLTQSLLATHEVSEATYLGESSLRKRLPSGESLAFTFFTKGKKDTKGFGVGKFTNEPEYIELDLLTETKGFQIEARYPLSFDQKGTFASHADRRNEGRVVSLLVTQALNTSDYQFLFRGSRWLFANLLAWDKPEIIWPEQLDQVSLPPGQESDRAIK